MASSLQSHGLQHSRLLCPLSMHAKSLQSCPTLCDPKDYSSPGFSVHGFSRQEYWSGLPFPSPRDLPDPGNQTSISYVSCIGQLVQGPPCQSMFELYNFNLSVSVSLLLASPGKPCPSLGAK